jgi:aminoglycoside 6'-N-acetyltransferase I
VAELSIRRLGHVDEAPWAGLRHALWPTHSEQALREELAEMASNGLVGFGAFDGKRLLGFAEFTERPYGDGCDTSPVAWLEGIYVRPEIRRQGIGRRLVTAGENWAREHGLSELGSDAELDNLASRLGHARWGFDETERVVRFRKVLR